MFKKKRGIKLHYNTQGLIFFICLDYKNQPQAMQKKILNLCLTIGGENWQMLFNILTTSKSIITIAEEHHASESVLYRLRKKFYEGW